MLVRLIMLVLVTLALAACLPGAELPARPLAVPLPETSILPSPSASLPPPATETPLVRSVQAACETRGIETIEEGAPDAVSLGWQEHRDESVGFSVWYPRGWRELEWENAFGVGPVSMPEDVQWGVFCVKTGEGILEDLIGAIGQQFGADRTDGSLAGWISELVFVEGSGWLFHLNNGAIEDDRFTAYHHRFRILP